MKPRVNDFVSDEILTHTDMNSIQDRITDLQKRNGDWCGNEPYVYNLTGGTQVVVGPHNGVVISNIELAGASETNVSIDGAFSHTGWWYLYAQNDGADGTGYAWDDNPPDVNRLMNDASSLQRYVCSVYVVTATLHSEVILSFRKERGRTTYRWSGLGTTNFRALGTGTANTATDVSLAQYLPPHARLAHLMLVMHVPTTGAFHAGKVSPKSDAMGATATSIDSQLYVGGYASDTSDVRIVEGPCETDSSQVVRYLVDVNTAVVNLDIFVRGFEE